jgi:hypothetical protein
LWYWSLNLAYTLSHSTNHFLWRVFFKMGSHELFAQADFWTAILLISASWVSRIIGVSHWRLTRAEFWEKGSNMFIRGGTGKVSLSKLCHPKRENVCFLKENSGVRLTYACPEWLLGLVHQVFRCHISEAVCLGWQVYFSGGQRERVEDWFNWRVKGISFGLSQHVDKEG